MLGTKGFDQKISLVRFSRNISQADHTCRYSFTKPIIVDNIVIILEDAIWNRATSHQSLNISQNLG